MARFPRIERLCPLSQEEQRRLDDDCRRCNKRVHTLDAWTDAEREAFLAASSGPVCVSYRVPTRRMTGFGLAMAATLAAGSALAGDAPAQLQSQSVESTPDEPQFEMIIVGGIEDPANAGWIDDSDLPDLPMVVEKISAKAAPIALPLKDPRRLR